MRSILRLTLTASILSALVAAPVRAEKLVEHDDFLLNLGVMLQPAFRFYAPPGDGADPTNDFFIRRVRLLVTGNLIKDISYFLQTETPNVGYNATDPAARWNLTFYVIDAYVAYKLADELTLDAGLLLAPFTHHGMQGAIGLHTIDYHANVMKYPGTIGRLWRDVGVQARGLLADKLIHYRLAVMNGAQPGSQGAGEPVINESDVPRVTGTVRVNLMGSEPAFYLQGIYFTKEPLLSVGLSGDFQPDVALEGTERKPYMAFAADVFADLPMGETNELAGQVSFYYWNNGEGASTTGIGLLAEVGYRIDKIEPVASFDIFMPSDDAAAAGKSMNWRVGANYWIDKHRANVKLDLGQTKAGDGDPGFVVNLQSQLFF
ncbi:OprO/OprP family phosphate-selective porin [Myxococcota bacterium]|nr:OprO/OprP family phosphate-selective porin [Myxococcota bacterium]